MATIVQQNESNLGGGTKVIFSKTTGVGNAFVLTWLPFAQH